MQLPRLQFMLPEAASDEGSLAATGPQTFDFRPHQADTRWHPLTRRQQAMADAQRSDELAELQKLSNVYEPDVTGPLVGDREPTTSLAAEYASADPVLQAKTAALPQKYSHYRPVRGDGRCGWRAIAFGYFETLISLGDQQRFLDEETRLRSLSHVLNDAGFDPLLYEDFADEFFNLIRVVADAQLHGQADVALLHAFNNETLQNYVITYLKTLTSAWMKTRPGDYEPWLLGQNVAHYCNQAVMPIGSEIDNVSLSALKDVFLSPIGLALEILYLDRTKGSEVNMHRFTPTNPRGIAIGTIRLLYRPGHYDLLYKSEDDRSWDVTANMQYASHTHEQVIHSLACNPLITLIPGMSYSNPQQAWAPNPTYGTIDSHPTPVDAKQPVHEAPMSKGKARQSIHTNPMPANTASQTIAPILLESSPPGSFPHGIQQPHTQQQVVNTVHKVPEPQFSSHQLPSEMAGPFRPSAWQLQPDLDGAVPQLPFQTSIFKNSHFNTAHFLNPDFQPEVWHPDTDYVAY